LLVEEINAWRGLLRRLGSRRRRRDGGRRNFLLTVVGGHAPVGVVGLFLFVFV